MCMALPSAFPRTHDRHGRTPRYVRLFPGLPVWKTRQETFDSTVALVISELTERWPEVATIEFATEDVPPSDPAPWEDHGVVLARVFPADRRKGLGDRIVLYRLTSIRHYAHSLPSASRISSTSHQRNLIPSPKRSGDLALPLQKVTKGATKALRRHALSTNML